MDDKHPENDHRRLGQELDLFVFSDLVGSGLPLWTPRGTVLRNELDRFVQEMRDKRGFQEVIIPHITKKDLYVKSGHWAKFNDDLFKVVSREGHEFVLKPMNCPHHSQIYASRPRSYRDLPIRYRETTMNFRDEHSGELNGLSRTRAFTQDDAHVFCREDQIFDEVMAIWNIIQTFYGKFDMSISLRFSSRDPKKIEGYSGTGEQWKIADSELRKVVNSQKDMSVEEEGVGEAAFYGPKLDFITKDHLGRTWQVATIQLDFAQPEGLGLTYVNEDGKEVRPVMIHCAVMGSIERFLSVYLEHTGGKLPVWLAPEQLRIATLNQDIAILEMASDILTEANKLGIRATVDDQSESVGKKIRDAEVMKVPYTIVIGDKEVKSGKVSARVRSDISDEDTESMDIEVFLKQIAEESANRSR